MREPNTLQYKTCFPDILLGVSFEKGEGAATEVTAVWDQDPIVRRLEFFRVTDTE